MKTAASYFKILLVAMCSLTSCKNDDIETDSDNIVDTTPLPSDKTNWWKPAANASFDWDLNELTSSDQFDANIVDLDAFSTTKEQVDALHAQGRRAIAYLSVGTFENGRPDGHLLPAKVVGAVYPEWPEEKWLDIRQIDLLKPLNSRFNMIIQKGFDAIEPDNLDGYQARTGFALTEEDARKYVDFLIKTAHENGLGIGQKNVPDLAVDYAAHFDWALTEDAFQQGWQNDMKPFTAIGKPVFAVEYTDQMSLSAFEKNVCPQAKAMGFNTIIKHRSLDKWTGRCGN